MFVFRRVRKDSGRYSSTTSSRERDLSPVIVNVHAAGGGSASGSPVDKKAEETRSSEASSSGHVDSGDTSGHGGGGSGEKPDDASDESVAGNGKQVRVSSV